MATAAQRARSYDEPLVGGGWVAFAGTMLILVGFFNIIDGIAAIANSDYLANQLLFANVRVAARTAVPGAVVVDVLALLDLPRECAAASPAGHEPG